MSYRSVYSVHPTVECLQAHSKAVVASILKDVYIKLEKKIFSLELLVELMC